MMQHLCRCCQSHPTPTAASSTEAGPITLVLEPADQHISSTCSRRLRDADDFLAAVEHLVGTHPDSTDTTVRVARDIASRMGKNRDGHVAFGRQGMMQRLGLARSTVSAHVRILRELGLLAWVVHGSRRNVLRTRLGRRFRPGAGFRGTATIYAVCAPPAWDHHQGRIREGHGYGSRIRAYTSQGRDKAIATARQKKKRQPAPRTPSFTSLPTDIPAPVVGQITTPRRHASEPSGVSRQRRRARGSTGWSAQQAQAAMAYAHRLRWEVWWAQSTCERRLAFALRPLIQAGYTSQQAARELISWGTRQRPDNAAGYIRAELRRRAHQGLLLLPEHAVGPRPEAPADEAGTRYAAMLARHDAVFGPVFARYRERLAGPLRAALRRHATRQPLTEPPRWKPLVREAWEQFWATLPSGHTPLEAYSARASGAPMHYRPADSPEQEAALAESADQAAAAAAFAHLRARLAAAAGAGPRRV